ncbi:MAG: ABC transporter permease [Planctomycetaceae bacterium]|nr:ABC transporter permease [Planctomycetaceae bacterium]
MTYASLIGKTLVHYWRTNLAVLLGVAIGTAVISGALIVGDSVRESLRQMTLDRLGQVDYALSGGRFFREELADALRERGLPGDSASPTDKQQVAPAILVTGTLRYEAARAERERDTETELGPPLRIAGRVNLIGSDERLWSMLNETRIAPPGPDDIVLNERTAEQLGVTVGDRVTLFVDIPQAIPQESLLGERDLDEQVVEFSLTVAGIAPSRSTTGRFSLQPNQQLPLNAYLQLSRLQEELDLAAVQASRRNPVARPARVNTLLVADPAFPSDQQTGDNTHASVTQLNEGLQALWELEDLYLHIREFPERGYFSLESDRMILERALSEQGQSVARQQSLDTSPVLVYLVNEIANARNPGHYSMYSVAAGVDLFESPPFGPFVNSSEQPVLELGPDEVVINSWLAEDLQVDRGDEIVIKYHVVGSRGELPEEELRLRVREIVTLADSPADDPGFTPYVEGITDARTFADWRQPFPMQMERITARDDEYWEQHRTTPKLFLNRERARALWQSRYGDTTSLRIATPSVLSSDDVVAEFRKQFRAELPAAELGLWLQPVKGQGLEAARGTQDFTGLFIAFSFFVIAAAMVLIGLLFQLGMETRVRQIGLYSALGFSDRGIQGLLLGEGMIVGLVGMLGGLVLAVWYAQLMIHGLTTWWQGAVGTSFLTTSVFAGSLVKGGVLAWVVSLPGMWLGVRRLLRVAPKTRLQGGIAADAPARQSRGTRLKGAVGTSCVGLALCLVAGVELRWIPASQAFGGFNWHIVCFFLSGFLLLLGSLLLFVVRLRSLGTGGLLGRTGLPAVGLGLRNLTRNRQRSTITVILVSLATFVVVAVAAGRQNPTNLEPDRNSGNGGFSLVAESARPLLHDPTTPSGQTQLGLVSSEDARLRSLLAASRMISFRVRHGEDASCLNLYQTRLPTILGVPQAMIERGGFLFADTPGENPWRLLEGRTASGHVPVLGDQNTLQYSLHKSLGSLIELPPELSAPVDLQVVGALAGSLFQGVLLMSEENFLELFPDVSGYGYFLIETDPARAEELTSLLEARLVTLGFDVEPIGRRLLNFLAVQNTYLSTFQALGGLGLLLGTFGLGTVMLRNVLERRSELALMRAIGFQRLSLAGMVLAENALLLILGLSIGTLCALVAMLPTISGQTGEVSWGNGLLLLLGVFLVGMLSSLLAILEAIRTPVLQTLRGE